jgi:LysM repeat protein
MRGRNPARYLVPIVLVGFALGIYLIVHHGLSTKPRSASAARTSSLARRAPRGPRFYVVQRGDVMTSIAAREHMSLAELELLNPRVFPDSLQAGQRLRLRR